MLALLDFQSILPLNLSGILNFLTEPRPPEINLFIFLVFPLLEIYIFFYSTPLEISIGILDRGFSGFLFEKAHFFKLRLPLEPLNIL